MYPFWKFLPAGLAHQLGPLGISLYSSLNGGPTPNWKSFQWRGLTFPNRLGIAGGVDKNADLLLQWPRIGVGFSEVGTITPRPQRPNPGKIVDRDWEHKNLWNKMGFPNIGCKEIKLNLENALEYKSTPWFLNIGKNRTTPNDCVAQDCLEIISHLHHLGDAFVLNVSSPNTLGLRALQSREHLEKLTSQIVAHLKSKPLLIKLSPDLTTEELEQSLEGGLQGGASGFILTNTTLRRPANCPFPKEGGLSGADLKNQSLHILKESLQILGSRRKDLLMISAGGVMTPSDVEERLAIGSDLVQIYSAMVFEGPQFFHQVAEKMNSDFLQKRST